MNNCGIDLKRVKLTQYHHEGHKIPIQFAHNAALNFRVDVDIAIALGSLRGWDVDMFELLLLFSDGHDGISDRTQERDHERRRRRKPQDN